MFDLIGPRPRGEFTITLDSSEHLRFIPDLSKHMVVHNFTECPYTRNDGSPMYRMYYTTEYSGWYLLYVYFKDGNIMVSYPQERIYMYTVDLLTDEDRMYHTISGTSPDFFLFRK